MYTQLMKSYHHMSFKYFTNRKIRKVTTAASRQKHESYLKWGPGETGGRTLASTEGLLRAGQLEGGCKSGHRLGVEPATYMVLGTDAEQAGPDCERPRSP